jgi:hypothetical protein
MASAPSSAWRSPDVPSARALALVVLFGLGAGLYFALWFRWPAFLAIGIGATLGVVMLLFASSLAANPEEADAAWRAAAPDLAERERGSGVEPELVAQPTPPDSTPDTDP